VGYIPGDIENVSGTTANINFTIWFISFTLFVDPCEDKVIGGTIGGGPGATPVGASGTASHTKAFTIRDLLKLRKKIIQKYF